MVVVHTATYMCSLSFSLFAFIPGFPSLMLIVGSGDSIAAREKKGGSKGSRKGRNSDRYLKSNASL